MGYFSRFLIEIWIGVQVCECCAYKGSFRKHYLLTWKIPW